MTERLKSNRVIQSVTRSSWPSYLYTRASGKRMLRRTISDTVRRRKLRVLDHRLAGRRYGERSGDEGRHTGNAEYAAFHMNSPGGEVNGKRQSPMHSGVADWYAHCNSYAAERRGASVAGGVTTRVHPASTRQVSCRVKEGQAPATHTNWRPNHPMRVTSS